jgi:hypothetical protein
MASITILHGSPLVFVDLRISLIKKFRCLGKLNSFLTSKESLFADPDYRILSPDT